MKWQTSSPDFYVIALNDSTQSDSAVDLLLNLNPTIAVLFDEPIPIFAHHVPN